MRYLSLWLHFARNSLLRQMEFQTNFIIDFFIEILWTLVTLFAVEILFIKTDSLAGWSKGEVIMIYALYRLSSGISAIITRRNIMHFSQLINQGELDHLLTKPVNIFFMSLTRIVALERLSPLITAGILLWYSFHLLSLKLDVQLAVVMVISIILGSLIRFCLETIIVTPIFWLQKLENIQSLIYTVFTPARFPRQAYPIIFARIFSFILPVLFVAAIPTEIILNKSPITWIIIMAFVALSLFIIAVNFFNFALKHYSSASS
jgi:ABC-2 type transport system permease protein